MTTNVDKVEKKLMQKAFPKKNAVYCPICKKFRSRHLEFCEGEMMCNKCAIKITKLNEGDVDKEFYSGREDY